MISIYEKGGFIMKRRKKVLFAVLSLVILLTITSCTAAANSADPTGAAQQSPLQKGWNCTFHYAGDYWNCYDLSKSFIPTQSDFETLVASYIPQIETLLGVQDWYTAIDADADTVLVNLEMGGTPHSMVWSPTKGSDGTIEFSILLSFNQIKTPGDRALAHELTHSVLGRSCFSNSLEEGICDYTAARIGVNYSIFFAENGIDIMDFYTYDVKAALEKIYDTEKGSKMLDSIGRSGGYPYSLQTQDGAMWYECSQSFVEYLVKNYGLDKTMQLIREGKGEEDYQTYLGISYEEVKEAWIAYVKNCEPQYTMEEYRKMAQSFFEVNGGGD